MAKRAGKAIQITGVDEITKAMKREPEKIRAAMIQALYRTGVDVVNKAITLAPIESGNLRATGETKEPRITSANKVIVELSFGGPTKDAPQGANYAAVQHERMDYAHPQGGQAKYLEQPFLQETANWPDSLVRRMRMLLHVGGGTI